MALFTLSEKNVWSTPSLIGNCNALNPATEFFTALLNSLALTIGLNGTFNDICAEPNAERTVDNTPCVSTTGVTGTLIVPDTLFIFALASLRSTVGVMLILPTSPTPLIAALRLALNASLSMSGDIFTVPLPRPLTALSILPLTAASSSRMLTSKNKSSSLVAISYVKTRYR